MLMFMMAQKHQQLNIAVQLSFFPHGPQNTVSPFILQHGESSVHCQINTLLGLFLLRRAAQEQIACLLRREGCLVLAGSNHVGSISPLSVNPSSKLQSKQKPCAHRFFCSSLSLPLTALHGFAFAKRTRHVSVAVYGGRRVPFHCCQRFFSGRWLDQSSEESVLPGNMNKSHTAFESVISG